MRVDRFLHHHFPWVVLSLLAIAAYFQARSFASIFEASLQSGATRTAPPRSATQTPSAALEHRASADAILARNPFDSTTGPLGAEGVTATLGAQRESAQAPCPGMRLMLVSTGGDPGDSFAAIVGSDGAPILRREGDAVDGALVEHIRWDRVELTSQAKPCILKLGDTPALPPKPPPSPVAVKNDLLGKVVGLIRKVNEREYDVDRAAMDVVMEHTVELLGRVRVRPKKEGSAVVGLALSGIQPESLLGAIGLMNGDELLAINGFDLTDPQRALEAYSRLRNTDRLDVAIARSGRPMTIDLNIR